MFAKFLTETYVLPELEFDGLTYFLEFVCQWSSNYESTFPILFCDFEKKKNC